MSSLYHQIKVYMYIPFLLKALIFFSHLGVSYIVFTLLWIMCSVSADRHFTLPDWTLRFATIAWLSLSLPIRIVMYSLFYPKEECHLLMYKLPSSMFHNTLFVFSYFCCLCVFICRIIPLKMLLLYLLCMLNVSRVCVDLAETCRTLTMVPPAVVLSSFFGSENSTNRIEQYVSMFLHFNTCFTI